MELFNETYEWFEHKYTRKNFWKLKLTSALSGVTVRPIIVKLTSFLWTNPTIPVHMLLSFKIPKPPSKEGARLYVKFS